MERRQFVAGIGLLAATGAAGCLDDGNTGGSNGNADDTPTPDDGTPTPDDGTPTPSGPSLEGASLEQVDGGCGQQTDSAEVAFESDADRVVVSGTIWGSDTCKVPTLADAVYDPDADRLAVVVTTRDRDTDGTRACGQCIVELEYWVTADFAGGLPGTVAVSHRRDGSDAVVTEATA